jgi:L-aminopeptidase/D-esterase-like protein
VEEFPLTDQADLVIRTGPTGSVLKFDFPGIHIGTAEYPEGPTGATVFWFPSKAVGAVDVRGGAPGSYNLDWLRQGHDFPNLDAITISGGSWYGLGTAAGVAAALKDNTHRSGHWNNLATVAGAIIYDYGLRRLTPYHPDDRLGRAALSAARPGVFPLGAQGAGRNTMQGAYFGLWLHSGQGGAFAQVGETKIAAFSVVNCVGVVVDRSGAVVAGAQPLPESAKHIDKLLAQIPNELYSDRNSIMGRRRRVGNPANTTISVVVTNQKLTYAELNRLAVQVHTSMGRMIQPLGTVNDGDILFAVSTAEIENPGLHPTDLAVVASETMWSAVLNSIPDIDPYRATETTIFEPAELSQTFKFGAEGLVEIRQTGNSLTLRSVGECSIFGIEPGETLVSAGREANSFLFASEILQRIAFKRDSDGKVMLVLNPGNWQQIGKILKA